VYRGVMALHVDDGLARLDSLAVRTSAGRIDAAGQFGLVPDRSGTLRVDVMADSLAALDGVLFPDSLALSLIDAAPSRIAGRLQLTADLEGGLDRFDAAGEAALTAARFHGAAAASAAVRFAASGIRTD